MLRITLKEVAWMEPPQTVKPKRKWETKQNEKQPNEGIINIIPWVVPKYNKINVGRSWSLYVVIEAKTTSMSLERSHNDCQQKWLCSVYPIELNFTLMRKVHISLKAQTKKWQRRRLKMRIYYGYYLFDHVCEKRGGRKFSSITHAAVKIRQLSLFLATS